MVLTVGQDTFEPVGISTVENLDFEVGHGGGHPVE